MGFLRHFTPELLSIKKSATFAHSTFRIIIPSVGFIPSLVAPQQSQCPFIPTNKSTENFYDTVRFTLPHWLLLSRASVRLSRQTKVLKIFMTQFVLHSQIIAFLTCAKLLHKK